MIIIEVFERGATPRHRSTAPATLIRIDTSSPCHNPANLLVALAGFRPATIELAQISAPRHGTTFMGQASEILDKNPNGASGLAIRVSANADMVRESIPMGSPTGHQGANRGLDRLDFVGSPQTGGPNAGTRDRPPFASLGTAFLAFASSRAPQQTGIIGSPISAAVPVPYCEEHEQRNRELSYPGLRRFVRWSLAR